MLQASHFVTDDRLIHISGSLLPGNYPFAGK